MEMKFKRRYQYRDFFDSKELVSEILDDAVKGNDQIEDMDRQIIALTDLVSFLVDKLPKEDLIQLANEFGYDEVK